MTVVKKTLKKVKSKGTRAKVARTTRTKRGRWRNPPSFIELKMGGLLKRMGLAATPQHRIPRVKVPKHNFYVDFALPGKIAIECDGAAYHSTPAQKRRDRLRQAELELMGWRMLRLTGSEIVTDIDGCEKKIRSFIGVK